MDTKRIVITGIGVVSPIGIGKEDFWQNLFKGNSGFKPITLFDTSDFKVKVAGEVTEFNPKDILGNQGLMDLDRATLLLLSAAKLALEDANLNITEENTKHIGVSVGTTFGSLHSTSRFDQESLKEGPRYVNPSIFPSVVGNSPASRLNIRFKIKGFSSTISTGMCSSLDAIDYARDFIRLNRNNIIIAGSVEDLSIQTFLGFYKLKYLSGLGDRGEPLSCPFDKRRDGIIFSEGSVVFILEDLNSARERKADIYAEILGIGSCFDPSKFYKYNPDGKSMSEAMRLVLKDADMSSEDIDCIFANANSTQDADYIETKAIKEVFGGNALKIPITAVKSMLGESYSVSGGLSLLAAVGSLKNNSIPPTINHKDKDVRCNLGYVFNKAQKNRINRAMINTFGSNGANTVLIVGRLE